MNKLKKRSKNTPKYKDNYKLKNSKVNVLNELVKQGHTLIVLEPKVNGEYIVPSPTENSFVNTTFR